MHAHVRTDVGTAVHATASPWTRMHAASAVAQVADSIGSCDWHAGLLKAAVGAGTNRHRVPARDGSRVILLPDFCARPTISHWLRARSPQPRPAPPQLPPPPAGLSTGFVHTALLGDASGISSRWGPPECSVAIERWRTARRRVSRRCAAVPAVPGRLRRQRRPASTAVTARRCPGRSPTRCRRWGAQQQPPARRSSSSRRACQGGCRRCSLWTA